MKTLFESATCMDIIHLNRVADLLAWFVSNNNYQWPWARWDRVLEASQLNAQRRFCSLALAKMIRLCANLAYIQQHILPQDDRWLTLIPPSDQPTAPPPDPDNPGGLVQPYEDIMGGLMSKISDDSMEEKLRKCGEESEGGLRDMLGYFVRTLLFRARTSPFHTETLLNRYQNTLKNIIASVRFLSQSCIPVLCCVPYRSLCSSVAALTRQIHAIKRLIHTRKMKWLFVNVLVHLCGCWCS